MHAAPPDWIQAAAWLLAGLVLAGQAVPLWRHLRGAGPQALRVLLAVGLALAALRWFNTAPLQGVMLHLTGASIATLLLGSGPALVVVALASLSGVLMGAAWHGWAPDYLVTGVLPVAVTAVASRAADAVVLALPNGKAADFVAAIDGGRLWVVTLAGDVPDSVRAAAVRLEPSVW